MNDLKTRLRKTLSDYLNFLVSLLFLFFHFTFLLSPISAQQLIGTLARVKGQEPTVIHGYGLVTGLRGTGDRPSEFRETARVLTRTMQLMGHPNITEPDVGTSRNVALVKVIATIPPQGARSGETLDITVSSIGSATSLRDGVLDVTDLLGPVPQTPEMISVFAKAWGHLIIEKTETPTVARVINGARLTAEFRNPYIRNGCITLVLPERHASWFMADAIALAVNLNEDAEIAKAHDQSTISVMIPYEEIADPVQFVARINAISIFDVDRIPKVMINERTGAIVSDPAVEIAPVAISHKNISIQAGAPQAGAPAQPDQTPNTWVKLDLEESRGGEPNVRLEALVNAMNLMRVPTQDIIDIIRTIDSKGGLYGKIEYE